MLVMTIGANNWEEEMVAIKAMLEKRTKERRIGGTYQAIRRKDCQANQKATETTRLILHKKLRKSG